MGGTLPRFEEVLDDYHDEIYRYLWRVTGGGSSDNALEVDDMVQETFVRAYNAYHRLHEDSNIRAWLYKIATNFAMSTFRRTNRKDRWIAPLTEERAAILPDPGETPEEHTLVLEVMTGVHEAVADLPDKQQSAFVMRYMQGLPYDEIAGALDCSYDSARANVYQALRTLRDELASHQAGR